MRHPHTLFCSIQANFVVASTAVYLDEWRELRREGSSGESKTHTAIILLATVLNTNFNIYFITCFVTQSEITLSLDVKFYNELIQMIPETFSSTSFYKVKAQKLILIVISYVV